MVNLWFDYLYKLILGGERAMLDQVANQLKGCDLNFSTPSGEAETEISRRLTAGFGNLSEAIRQAAAKNASATTLARNTALIDFALKQLQKSGKEVTAASVAKQMSTMLFALLADAINVVPTAMPCVSQYLGVATFH